MANKKLIQVPVNWYISINSKRHVDIYEGNDFIFTYAGNWDECDFLIPETVVEEVESCWDKSLNSKIKKSDLKIYSDYIRGKTLTSNLKIETNGVKREEKLVVSLTTNESLDNFNINVVKPYYICYFDGNFLEKVFEKKLKEMSEKLSSFKEKAQRQYGKDFTIKFIELLNAE